MLGAFKSNRLEGGSCIDWSVAPLSYIIIEQAVVAEWYTRWSQKPLRATSCGFDSHPRHQFTSTTKLHRHQDILFDTKLFILAYA